MKTQKVPYWKTHANWDNAGNCMFCGEAGRCKCSHPPLSIESQHTPTPWRLAGKAIDAKGYRVRGVDIDEADRSLALVDKEENAAFIVRAVNSHDDMLDQLKNSLVYLNQNKKCRIGSDQWMIEQNIRKAIAKAEGK